MVFVDVSESLKKLRLKIQFCGDRHYMQNFYRIILQNEYQFHCVNLINVYLSTTANFISPVGYSRKGCHELRTTVKT